jgi:PAS domain S-box-containing protein
MRPGSPASRDTSAAIVEFSDDAIIGLTLDGVVTSWNAAAERMYGYSAEEMIGQDTARIVPADVYAAEQQVFLTVADGGPRVESSDTSRVRRDGAHLVVSRSLFSIEDSDRRTIALAAIERDVTRQRSLETRTLKAKGTEAVGRLAGGVADEFNNINTTILALVEFIGQDLTEASRAREDLDEIAKQAVRGSRLARHLLAISGRETVAAHELSVDDALRDLEPLLRRLVGERGRLTLDLVRDGSCVNADESQLELVMFELVINASDAIGDGGSIAISTNLTVVDETSVSSPAGVPHGTYVQIIVRESGPGVRDGVRDTDADDIAPPSTTLSDRTDAGLGLAVAHGIVRHLGGFVTFTSVLPLRNDVSVFLPIVKATSMTADSARDGKANLGGTETILVVDDEEPVRKVISRGLRSHGYNVIEAQHGEDALVVAGAFGAPIHLVVSDVVMPQMDGRALFERLRTWYPHIRFLFVSGYTRGVITGDELEGSATAFLAKPFGLEQLCEQVRGLLDQPRQKLKD